MGTIYRGIRYEGNLPHLDGKENLSPGDPLHQSQQIGHYRGCGIHFQLVRLPWAHTLEESWNSTLV
jgi:hypothetical protein